MDNTNQLTHLCLCAGYDGIGKGLELAGYPIGFNIFVEVEAFPSANLVNKVEECGLAPGVLYPDVKTFPYADFHGCIDILSAGFPCQPFSAAGQRRADDDPRHLWPHIKEGIRQCRPSLVLLENVDGIVSARLGGDDWEDPKGTPVLLHVLRELERLGYRAEAGCFTASETGAPHQRKRWFIMAYPTSDEGGGNYGIGEPRQLDQADAVRWPARPGQPQHDWEPPRVC